MKEIVQSLFKRPKIIISIILIVIIFIVFNYLTEGTLKLKINATPEDAKITITEGGNSYSATGIFEKELEKNIYNIKVEKDGYITEQRQINLEKETEVNINLLLSSNSGIINSYSQTNIIPIDFVSNSNNGEVYGVNKKTGNLIKLEEGKEITIYDGVVKDYDIKGNLAIVIDISNLEQIIIIDLKNLSKRVIEEKQISPIVSVSLSQDLQKIYLLSEFDISDKISSLGSISLNGSGYQKISETSAQSLEFLKDSVVLLSEENHGQDSNEITLYDILKKETILSLKTGSYKISPDGNTILFQRSNGIQVLNVSNYQSKSKTVTSSRSVWKNNNTAILIKNSEGNSYYSILTVNPFQITAFQLLKEETSILNVFGFSNNKLYLQDYKDNIFTVELPGI